MAKKILSRDPAHILMPLFLLLCLILFLSCTNPPTPSSKPQPVPGDTIVKTDATTTPQIITPLTLQIALLNKGDLENCPKESNSNKSLKIIDMLAGETQEYTINVSASNNRFAILDGTLTLTCKSGEKTPVDSLISLSSSQFYVHLDSTDLSWNEDFRIRHLDAACDRIIDAVITCKLSVDPTYTNDFNLPILSEIVIIIHPQPIEQIPSPPFPVPEP